jgi:hypothetical protein
MFVQLSLKHLIQIVGFVLMSLPLSLARLHQDLLQALMLYDLVLFVLLPLAYLQPEMGFVDCYPFVTSM